MNILKVNKLVVKHTLLAAKVWQFYPLNRR